MATNYTNATNISQFLQRSLSANESSALTSFVLDAIDKWIDRLLQSHFADEDATTRYFDGGGHSIDIDPCQNITSVKSVNNDGSDSYSYTENTELIYEPVNEVIKREITYRGGRHFPRGQRRMAVTAQFTEYDYVNNEVPPDVILAATRLAGAIIGAGKTSGQGGNIQQESLEGHTVRYDITSNALEALSNEDPIIQNMIAQRREIYIFDEDGRDDDYDW